MVIQKSGNITSSVEQSQNGYATFGKSGSQSLLPSSSKDANGA